MAQAGAEGQQEDEDPDVASVLEDMVRDHGEVQVQAWAFVVAAYALVDLDSYDVVANFEPEADLVDVVENSGQERSTQLLP